MKTTVQFAMISTVLVWSIGCVSEWNPETDAGDVDIVDVAADTGADAGDPLPDVGCVPGTGDCNGIPGDGCETDTTTDPAHCGGCWHDCQGGTCVMSVCQPVSVTDPPGTSTGPWNGFIAVGPSNVYISYAATPTGGVAWAPKSGDAGTCIACDQGEPREIATGDAAVYWTDPTLDEVRMAPLGATGFTAIWMGQVGTPIAVDSIHVFFWDQSSGDIIQTDLDGSNLTILDSGYGEVRSIAAHSGRLYWIDHQDLYALELSTGTPTPMFSGLNDPKSVAADTSHVYWVEGTWGGVNHVYRTPVGGATPELLATHGAFDIALDATHVYVADSEGGDIWRVLKTGGVVEILATGQPFPFDIAVDDAAVYWSSETDAGVDRVAK